MKKTALKRVPMKRKVSGIAKVSKRASTGQIKPNKKKSKSTAKKPSLKKADTLFSRFIRDRDGKCVRCGKTEYLQNSHFWPRAISNVRFDPENCDALCYGCHYGDRYHGWEYAKQGEYRDFKISQLGEERYQALALRATITVKRQDAINQCLDQLKEIQAIGQLNDSAVIVD
jgi:hypothetical protein